MTIDELKPEEYTLDSDTEKKSDFYGQNIPVVGKLIGGLSNVGIGIGTEIGKGGLGLSQLALKAAQKVTGVDYSQEIETAKNLSQKLYGEPFKKELGTTTGKAGQIAGIATQFMAPSSKIISGQKILSALSKPLAGGKLAGFGAKVISRAIPEAISDFGVELARSGGDVKRAEFAGITGGIASGVFTTLGSAAKATFWPELRDSTTRALGVQSKTTGGRILPQIEKKVAGLGVIKKYSPLIKVKDDLGIEKAFKPERANFHETLQAWNQTRKIIYNDYSKISSSLGDELTIDLTKIGEDLSDIVNAPRTSVYKNAAQSYLQDLQSNFGMKTRGEEIFRKVNPKEIETYLSDLYNEAGATIAGRTDKAHGEIAAGLAGKLRQILDDTIENASGSQYSKLRGEYSALKEIEQDLVRRFQQEARQVGGGLTDYVNLFSSGDIISGIMTGQPALIAKGTTQGIMGRLFKSLKKPDRYMRRAFDLIDQKKIGDISARLFGTSDEALSPTEARIVNSVRSYLKNPKIGMSIEDVSKKGSGATRTTSDNLTTKFLEYAKNKTTLSKQEILDFARRPELKKGEADLLNKLATDLPEGKLPAQEFTDSIRRDLLELKAVKVKEPQYGWTTIEGRNNPNSLNFNKVKGKNYEEIVYESPITTNGSSHYPNSKNYFAHARGDEVVESGKKIWREQEIQSDLLQKDNLENRFRFEGSIDDNKLGNLTELQRFKIRKVNPTNESIQQGIDILKKNKFSEYSIQEYIKNEKQRMKVYSSEKKQFNQLSPFTNDRYGERIMRERIKAKAQAGYEKYRLPTGETIGKIEGFERNTWFEPFEFGTPTGLKPENLKIGKEVSQGRGGENWIITDILGDGRFKAVPKDALKRYTGDVSRHDIKSEELKLDLSPENLKEAAKYSETFDLTGKSNPQYRRYSDWGKFLKNKFGGKEITDQQGNTWMEIDLKKEMGKMPVEAFGALGLPLLDQDE